MAEQLQLDGDYCEKCGESLYWTSYNPELNKEKKEDHFTCMSCGWTRPRRDTDFKEFYKND